MIDTETGCVLIYNGEIYNCRELRKELMDQMSLLWVTHTEVLYLLRREGSKILSKLRGIFALHFINHKQTRFSWDGMHLRKAFIFQD